MVEKKKKTDRTARFSAKSFRGRTSKKRFVATFWCQKILPVSGVVPSFLERVGCGAIFLGPCRQVSLLTRCEHNMEQHSNLPTDSLIPPPPDVPKSVPKAFRLTLQIVKETQTSVRLRFGISESFEKFKELVLKQLSGQQIRRLYYLDGTKEFGLQDLFSPGPLASSHL